jgi:hypothetical protein
MLCPSQRLTNEFVLNTLPDVAGGSPPWDGKETSLKNIRPGVSHDHAIQDQALPMQAIVNSDDKMLLWQQIRV